MGVVGLIGDLGVVGIIGDVGMMLDLGETCIVGMYSSEKCRLVNRIFIANFVVNVFKRLKREFTHSGIASFLTPYYPEASERQKSKTKVSDNKSRTTKSDKRLKSPRQRVRETRGI